MPRWDDAYHVSPALGLSVQPLGTLVGCGFNYAHNNYFMIFVDALIAVLLLGLLALRYQVAARRGRANA